MVAVAAEWADQAMAPVDLGRDLGSVAAAAPGAEQAQGPAEAQAQAVRARAAEASGRRAPGPGLPAKVMDRVLVRVQVPGGLQVLAAGSAVQVLEEGQAVRARVPAGAERGLLENG